MIEQAREKIRAEMEKKLKEKPIEIHPEKVIEKIPEAIEQELATLREKVRKADEEESILKFRMYFEELTGVFGKLLTELANMGEENRERYKKAVHALLEKMEERL